MDHTEGTFDGFEGLELYYQRWQPDGEAKAVLAVTHGFGEHSGRYGNVVDWFAPKGYAVYGFDHRGHGRSPGPRGYINSFAEFRGDVKAFLEFIHEQEPNRPVVLLGHSMGGLVALEYVLHHPEGLVGVIASGPLLAQAGISPLLVWLSKVLSSILPRFSLATGLDTTALSRDAVVVEAYENDPLVHGLGTPRLATELTKAFEWAQAHAADMSIPCLIVHGSTDRLVPPEGSRVFYENMTFGDKERRVYEGYFHEVFNDVGKEQVLADVEAWVERRLPSS